MSIAPIVTAVTVKVPPARAFTLFTQQISQWWQGRGGCLIGQNPWVDIGEGDEDWPEVLKALADVGYTGWATAEVGGGGEDWLKKVSSQMDKVLGLS